MASMTTEPNGHRTIQFCGPDRKRRSIRLGKVSKQLAEEILGHVEHLAECWRWQRTVHPHTDRWVSKLLADPARHQLYDRLAAARLVPEREPATDPEVPRLGEFLDAYIQGRTDVKDGTVQNLDQSKRLLVEYFGESKPLADITPGDADDYRRWLLTKLSENSTRRYCGRAKQFLRAAVRKRLIPESPFVDMKSCCVQANREREHFVSREEIGKALAACPDVEWQLIIALSRYGGVRTPSETLELEWTDVDWEHSRMTVRSPKTERHEGKSSRVVPIFPELRPYLERAFDEAEPGAVYLITRYRNRRGTLWTQFEQILRRAGVPAWPKLFQNCRASRATELAAEFPAHVAAEWLGHSTLVAAKHYWRVTEADFARATAEAVQNPVQSGSICLGSRSTKAVHQLAGKPEKTGVVASGAQPLLECRMFLFSRKPAIRVKEVPAVCRP
jgi:integrase